MGTNAVSLRLGQQNMADNRITVDGHELASGCYRLDLVSDAADMPRLTVHMLGAPIAAELAARVTVIQIDRAALDDALEQAYALGRHQPEGQPRDLRLWSDALARLKSMVIREAESRA